jgi:hypothetical protein
MEEEEDAACCATAAVPAADSDDCGYIGTDERDAVDDKSGSPWCMA